jgi:hypothetical protein
MTLKDSLRTVVHATACIAGLLLAFAAPVAAQGYSPAECVRRLNAQGLTPVLRVQPQLSPNVHAFCTFGDRYTAISLVGCVNARTGAVAATSLDGGSFYGTCSALMQKDSNWSFVSGFTCCAGTDGVGLSRRAPADRTRGKTQYMRID